MVASLHLTRWPLGVAQMELARAGRQGSELLASGGATILLPIRFRFQPLPVGRLGSFGALAFWPDEDSRRAFTRSRLASRWAGAAEHLALDLVPLGASGSWPRVAPPIGGGNRDADGGPILAITHSRTPPARGAAFMRASRSVAATMSGHPGLLWREGFIDRVRSFETGTLSLWRDTEAMSEFAYEGAPHREAMRSARDRGWFLESWFARFRVSSARGSWHGLDADQLRRTLPSGARTTPECG